MTDEEKEAEFVSLLTTHQSAVRLYIASLLPGESRVADVAQQANLTIWNKRNDFELGTNFKAWAFAIARYEVLNFRKQEARNARLQFSDELEEIIAEEMVSASDDFDDRREALRGCLKKLRPNDLALIQHRYYRDTSLQEYADEVGRSMGGLKVSLHRLRSSLAKCVQRNLSQAGQGS